MSNYPKPWKVKFDRRCLEWDEHSSPYIVDAADRLVVSMPQTVDHPGDYDQLAVRTAYEIVQAVNASHGAYGL